MLNVIKTKYLMYTDYGGMMTDLPKLGSFEVEHKDDGLDGITEAREYIDNRYTQIFQSILDVINPDNVDIYWTRDICVYQLSCDILIENIESYELFSFSITTESNREWIQDFIKDIYYDNVFQEIIKA